MTDQINKIACKFDEAIVSTINPTQKMIDTVSNEWEYQNENYNDVNLNPENCEGMSQLQIDATTEWLYKNN